MAGQENPSDDMFFCVEASNDPKKFPAALIRYFPSKEEAIAFAQDMLSKWRYIWVDEMGEYETRSGSRKKDWIVFWWNKPAGDEYVWPFPPPGQSTGYPGKALTKFVEYTPLLKDEQER